MPATTTVETSATGIRVTASETLAIAIRWTRATSFEKDCSSRADVSGNTSTWTANATTCAAPRSARSRPLVPSASSRSTTCAMTGAARADLWHGDLDRLRSAGLIRTVAPFDRDGERTTLVTLTDRGRELLEDHRRPDHEPRQLFYAGDVRERELSHDAQVYRAYLREAERLVEHDAYIHRVVLEQELRREYQQFLQERNRDRPESDGRPDRDPREIEAWAHDHDLPYFDDRVHFPDVRIEYEWPDGRRDIEDIEVTTPHYRGAHAAAKAKAGFTQFRGSSSRVGGRSSRLGGEPFDPDVAEEFLE